jgi:hypothetical protein
MIRRAGRSRVAEYAAPGISDEPLPLPVVPDWDQHVRHASLLTRLIDRHLDYEEQTRLVLSDCMTPLGLCPEQRVSLLTDLMATLRSI